MAALAFIGNIFIVLYNLVVDVFVMIYNLVATVANFIGNVFNDPVGAVCRLFFDLADTVLSVLQSLASAIDTIFGSNLSGAVQGWRDSLGGWVDSTFGKGTEVMAKMDANAMHLGRFEYGKAFDLGYNFGEGIDNKISGMFDFPGADSMGAGSGFDLGGGMGQYNLGNAANDIAGSSADTAGNTAAMADTQNGKQSTGSLPLKSRLNSTMKTTLTGTPILMGSWMLGPPILPKSWTFLKKG